MITHDEALILFRLQISQIKDKVGLLSYLYEFRDDPFYKDIKSVAKYSLKEFTFDVNHPQFPEKMLKSCSFDFFEDKVRPILWYNPQPTILEKWQEYNQAGLAKWTTAAAL